MYNIKFAGIYKDEKQLRKADEQEKSVRFNEPDNINNAFIEGLKISGSFFAVILLTTCYMFHNMFVSGTILKREFIIGLIISSIIVFVEQYIHEIIHALFFPREALKEIYISKDFMSMFVYSTYPVSKGRFILICIAPNLILGLLPFVIGILMSESGTSIVSAILTITGMVMMLCGVGDYLNIYNTLDQVPDNGFVYNDGFHTYWYEMGERKANNNSAVLRLIILLFLCGALLISMRYKIGLLFYVFSSWIAIFYQGKLFRLFKVLNVILLVLSILVLQGIF